MPINPVYTPIGEIFKRYVCSVPRFQRGYTWDEPQVSDFINDVLVCLDLRSTGKDARDHFLGAVVGVEGQIAGSLDKSCGLIDGQQRIATFVLFARALELTFQKVGTQPGIKAEVKARASERATSLRGDYLRQRIEINAVFKDIDRLTLSAPDEAYFSSLVNQPPDTVAPGTRESHERLRQSLDLISKKIAEIVEGEPTAKKKVDVLAHLGDVLRRDLTVILMPTNNQADAYRFFQVLNDRGTNLSEGDLLRASTLEMLSDPAYQAQHDAVGVMWDELLALKPADTAKFLRCYYTAVKGDRPGLSSLYDDFMTVFFPNYMGALHAAAEVQQVVDTVTRILAEFRQYRLIIQGEWPYPPSTTTDPWEKERLALLVVILDHELCHPLLLAASHLDEKKFSEVVKLIERIAFRYKYVCNAHATPLNNVYLKQAQLINTAPGTYAVKTMKDAFHDLQEKRADEALFRADMERLCYKEGGGGNKPLKYFLLTAEYYWRWFVGGATGNPKCHEPNRVIDAAASTIEHIYAKSASSSIAELDPLVNELGNLTILSQPDNDRVANKDFAAKKPIFKAGSFLMNQEIAKKSKWSAAALNARQQKLITLAVKVFQV